MFLEVVLRLGYETRIFSLSRPYSWSKFGRESEFVITIYLKLKGWNIQLSKGSRGPADIIATRDSTRWFIQVKSSTMLPRLKGYEVKRLKEMAENHDGLAIIAILRLIQSTEANGALEKVNKKQDIINLGNYALFFYSLHNWERITDI